ncbi:MAG TPA: MBL fold metallo-hydrolase [bacterium]|nr:MBL fold metallo-hydrolase [bacterium]
MKSKGAKMALTIGISLVVFLTAMTLAVGYAFSAPTFRGDNSDHFDGEKFFNPHWRTQHHFGDFFKWTLNREAGPWREWDEIQPGPPPPRRVDDGELRVTFVNHSTVLVQMDGLNVLTDPVWSLRASPVSWAGPQRVHAPGLRFADLPPIDVVLLSHNHYDHMDLATLRRLTREHRPVFVTGLGNAEFLRKKSIAPARDLDWWQSTTVNESLQITFVPAQHFSGRSMFDRNRTLWGGFVLHGAHGNVYFAGDTGYAPHFAEIRERFGDIRLAMLPIGAYRPQWFMSPVHTSPAEAVRAYRELDAAFGMGIHYGTFRLADDAQDEPRERLVAALVEEKIAPESFFLLSPGEGREVPARATARQ